MFIGIAIFASVVLWLMVKEKVFRKVVFVGLGIVTVLGVGVAIWYYGIHLPAEARKAKQEAAYTSIWLEDGTALKLKGSHLTQNQVAAGVVKFLASRAPNVSGLVNDQNFQRLPLDQQREALRLETGDERFGKLSDADTFAFVSKMQTPSRVLDSTVDAFLALDDNKKREILGKLSEPSKQALLAGIKSRATPSETQRKSKEADGYVKIRAILYGESDLSGRAIGPAAIDDMVEILARDNGYRTLRIEDMKNGFQGWIPEDNVELVVVKSVAGGAGKTSKDPTAVHPLQSEEK